MAEKTSPFLEAKWGWPYGSNGWNTGADENWLKFSYMFDRNVDGIVSSLPPAVSGQAYFNTTDNRFYFVVDGTYYSSPCPKWFVFNLRSSGDSYQFNGSSLTLLESISSLDSRVDDVELITTGLKSIRYYGAVENVDCSLAIINSYTDTGKVWIPEGNFVATLTLSNADTLLLALSVADLSGNLSVSIDAGRFTRTSPVLLEKFPNGSLKIEGYTPSSVSIIGQVSVAGVAGAYDVVLQLDNAFGTVVGEALHTWDVVGTGSPQVHRGLWEITAVDTLNNRITVRNTCWKPTFPTNTITNSNSVIIKTTFKFNNCDGFVVKSSRIDLLDKIGIFGNSDDYWSSLDVNGTEKGTHGLYVGAMTIALNGKVDNVNRYGVSGSHVSCGPYVGINGFDQQGVCTELSASVWGDFISACNNKRRGVYASTASGIRAKHISVNGNFLDGAISDLGGAIYASSESCAVGNGRTGASSTQGGMVIFDGGYLHDNGAHGASAVQGGILQAVSASYVGNILQGIYAEYGGVAYCNNSNMSNNGQNGMYAAFASQLRANNCTSNNNGAYGLRVDDSGSVVNITGTTFSGNTSGDMNLNSSGMTRGSTTLAGELYGEDVRLRNTGTRNGVRLSPSSDGLTAFLQYDSTASDSYSGGYVFANNSNGFYPSDDGVKVCGRPGNKFAAVNSVLATYTGPVRCGQYTLATLPSASVYSGYEIDVTDATGGPKRCRSNGTVWQILNTTTTVS